MPAMLINSVGFWTGIIVRPSSACALQTKPPAWIVRITISLLNYLFGGYNDVTIFEKV
jgi:hypothetical protein